jgi:hypothetical protein
MGLPDKNVRPIGFLKSLHSSSPLPTGRQAQGGTFCSIFVIYEKYFHARENKKADLKSAFGVCPLFGATTLI